MIAFRRETHRPRRGVRGGGRPLYAVGDVHGCYDLLRALLAEIGRDAAARYPGVTPMLVMCGDYIDRGPDSAKVLTALNWLLRSPAVDVTLLEGNHEAMLRLFIDRPTAHSRWLSFGGAQTLASYGLNVPDGAPDEATMTVLRDRLLDAMPTSHYQLLDRLEPMVSTGDYVFVHAGVRPGVALDAQHREDLQWIRDEFLDHPDPSAAVVVHGHTWEDDRATVLPHRIGIDTGAYQTGVLTALRIEDDAIDVIQAVDGRTG